MADKLGDSLKINTETPLSAFSYGNDVNSSSVAPSYTDSDGGFSWSKYADSDAYKTYRKNNPIKSGTESSSFLNGANMEGYAGLASALTGLFALPYQISAAKQAKKVSEFNLAERRKDAEVKDNMRLNLNKNMFA